MNRRAFFRFAAVAPIVGVAGAEAAPQPGFPDGTVFANGSIRSGRFVWHNHQLTTHDLPAHTHSILFNEQNLCALSSTT